MKLNYPIAGLVLFLTAVTSAEAQTFNAIRLDGKPATAGVSDPLVDQSTLSRVGGQDSTLNIDGPSVIRLPNWIPAEERIHPSAVYYMYFAHHSGHDIRLAWSDSITGTWTLFNRGSAPDRAWGGSGNNTGTQTPGNGVLDIDLGDSYAGLGRVLTADPVPSGTNPDGNIIGPWGHIASPDVFVDSVNERIVMYFHGNSNHRGVQKTFVTTSKYGLNFNPDHLGGEAGHGMRDTIISEYYMRLFEVDGRSFAFSNEGELWQAPATNQAGQTNTIANADTEGGLWNPITSHAYQDIWWDEMPLNSNPIEQLYVNNGQGLNDARHFGTYTRTHRDSSDTNVYVFYTAREDAPESIFLTVIDTDGGSTNSANWTPIGQRVILEPALDWEGADLPITTSQNGGGIGLRQVRDPYIFEDTMGTADLTDDKVYIFYCGRGEEAIGVAELVFSSAVSNTAAPQGDLFPNPPTVDEISVDFNGNGGATQPGFEGEVSPGDGNGLHVTTTTFTDPFGGGDILVTMSADRWKSRSPLTGDHADQNNLLRDFAGPVTAGTATLTLKMPAGEYEITLYQHESNRSAAETAILQITDANGVTNPMALTSSFGTNPAQVAVTVHTALSNGTADVVFTIDNTDGTTTGAYPINGVTITPNLVADSDLDGIPDHWETANGLNPSSAADRDTDLDSDGLTNFEEWVALSDPNDTSSGIDTVISISDTTLSVQFDGNPERMYSIISSPDLGPIEGWDVITNPRAGQGADDEFILSLDPQELRMFYRLVIEVLQKK